MLEKKMKMANLDAVTVKDGFWKNYMELVRCRMIPCFHNEYKWKESYFQDQYYQAGKPVRDQERAEGHAVRAVYLYSGMAEVAAMTEENRYNA